jgi:hypothetical protein
VRAEAREVVHDFEARIGRVEIDRGHIGQERELERGVIAKRRAHIEQVLAIDRDGRHVARIERVDRGARHRGAKQLGERLGVHGRA